MVKYIVFYILWLMIRLLIIVICGFLGFILFNKLKNAISAVKKPLSNKANKMLACSVCGTHIPEQNVIRSNDKIYCSKDCINK